jgi:hypothetical protein
LATALGRSVSALPSVRESYRRWVAADREDGTPAGTRLRTWLDRKNKRDRADLAGFIPDVTDEARDLVGIRLEADALAYLIASRDVRPPLAIGLFGDWGSGKSFLMRSVQRRIRTLGSMVAESDQRAVPQVDVLG